MLLNKTTKAMALLFLGVASQSLQANEVAGSRTISRAQIEKYASDYDPYGLASLLSTMAGVTFKSNGDVGGEDWLAVRGNTRDSSRMTLMLVDGRPYNSVSNNTLEFNTLPLSMIESITVHYGPLPSRFGGYTSVVEIKTRGITDHMEVAAGLAELGTQTAHFSVGSKGEWSWQFSLNAQQTDGLEDETYILRDSDDYSDVEYTYGDRHYYQVVPSVKVETGLNDKVNVELLAQAQLTGKRYDDGFSDYEIDQQAERVRRFYNLGVSLLPAQAGDDFDATFYVDHEAKETLVLDDELVNYGEQTKTAFGLRGNFHTKINDLIGVRLGGEFQSVTGSVEDDAMVVESSGVYTAVSTEDSPNPYYAYVNDLQTGAIYAELDGSFAGISYDLGLRHDSVYGYESKYSPYLSLSYSLTDNVSLFASAGQTVRLPSLNEYNSSERPVKTVLYSVLSNYMPSAVLSALTYDSKPLKFETQQGYQLGIKGSWMEGQLTTQASFYDYDHEGYIFTDVVTAPVYLYGNPFGTMAATLMPAYAYLFSNFNELPVLYRSNKPETDRTKGWDANLDYQGDAIGAYLNVSYIEIDSSYSDGRASHNGWFSPPKVTANAGVSYSFDNTQISLQTQYRGKTVASLQEKGDYPDVELESSLLVHLMVNQQLGSWQLQGKIHNLTDKKYETFEGLPMVGRQVFVQAKYQF